MRTIRTKKYPVYIGTGLLKKISSLLGQDTYSSMVFVTDSIVNKKVKLPNPVVIPAGEKFKNLETTKKIWKAFMKRKMDKKSVAINVGGGVLGDMGGFAAATYMRGMAFVQVPTTLLAMVDASVGGKTGVNFAGVKNSVGIICQPKAVVIDVSLLKTLPEHIFNDGFAEIIKHGLIYDKKYFAKVTEKAPAEFTVKEMERIIGRSCEIKTSIVKKDEKERGMRKVLNFGHTIGHAIEELSQQTTPIRHGEAVAIGMVAEAKISKALGWLSQKDVELITKKLAQAHLPIRTKFSAEKIWQRLQHDKKNIKREVRWTLLKKIGKGVHDVSVPKKTVLRVLNTY